MVVGGLQNGGDSGDDGGGDGDDNDGDGSALLLEWINICDLLNS